MARKPKKSVEWEVPTQAEAAAKVVAPEMPVAEVAESAPVVEAAPVVLAPKRAKVEPVGTSNMDKLIAEAVERALTAALPAMAKMSMTMASQASIDAQTAMHAAQNPQVDPEKNSVCGDCRQLKRCCKGKHRWVKVFPENFRYAKHFQGVQINGVVYKSAWPQQKVCIPYDASVEYTAQHFEANEEIQANGREAFHDSGQIGPKGQQFNPMIPDSALNR